MILEVAWMFSLFFQELRASLQFLKSWRVILQFSLDLANMVFWETLGVKVKLCETFRGQSVIMRKF